MKHFQEMKHFYMALSLTLITLALSVLYLPYKESHLGGSFLYTVFCLFIFIGFFNDEEGITKKMAFYTIGIANAILAFSVIQFCLATSIGISTGIIIALMILIPFEVILYRFCRNFFEVEENHCIRYHPGASS